MKTTITVFVILQSLFCIAQQNLVINGSFEVLDSQFYSPTHRLTYFPADNWWKEDASKPEYLHPNHLNGYLRTPNTAFGKLNAQDGVGFVHLMLIYVPVGKSVFDKGSTEHVQGELTDTLQAGKTYKVSFWAKTTLESSEYFYDNFGIRFETKKSDIAKNGFSSKRQYDCQYWNSITPSFTADVANKKGNFITDSSWVEISGIYTAKGGEKFITIGLFWDDNPKIAKEWQRINIKYSKKFKPDQIMRISESDKRKFSRVFIKYALKKNPNKTMWGEGIDDSASILIDNVSVVAID